eukprot:1097163-Pelagomonas_calceolata.AAC.5
MHQLSACLQERSHQQQQQQQQQKQIQHLPTEQELNEDGQQRQGNWAQAACAAHPLHHACLQAVSTYNSDSLLIPSTSPSSTSHAPALNRGSSYHSTSSTCTTITSSNTPTASASHPDPKRSGAQAWDVAWKSISATFCFE